jgi:hypothetical protein
MSKGLLFGAALAALMSAGAAHAGMIGLKLDGTIALGPGGIDQQWGAPPVTIGSGLEFVNTGTGNFYSANFNNTQLIIHDVEKPQQTSTGWEMTFAFLSPVDLKKVTLVSSNFGSNFTYSVSGKTLTVNWTGDAAYNGLTLRERRALGVERFKAVFRVATTDEQVLPVPEPGTLPMLVAGLLAAASAFGWRRNKTA